MQKISRSELAETLDNFLSGRGGRWDWDDFISVKLDDPELDEIRRICAELPERYPPGREGVYCSHEGLDVLRSILERLRSSGS